MPMYPSKRRRTATAVLAGDFDPRPSRDVLTSVLNGVAPYKAVEREEATRRDRKKEKRERERERRRAKAAEKAKHRECLQQQNAHAGPSNSAASASASTSRPAPSSVPTATTSTSSFWRARPAIHIPSAHQRPSSVTPPPSPRSTPTPDRYAASSSRNSSKRPRTPSDALDLLLPDVASSATMSPQPAHQRKRRAAARKGWKGWVEGSPPPSDKLINLDVAQVLPERRTRSGKSFDAIGVGKDSWV